jgi:hypothetical protein
VLAAEVGSRRQWKSSVIRPEGLATITMLFSCPSLAAVIFSFPAACKRESASLKR